ncbi:MAG: hypothetical protein ACSLE2_12860 [Lysobacterales bacterium]
MNRITRSEIADLLMQIYALSDSEDYKDEIRLEAVRSAGSGAGMKKLISALETAHPELFKQAIRGTTLLDRIRRQAYDLAQFLADKELKGCTQEQWALEHDMEPKTLQRALNKYRKEPKFRASVDEKIAMWKKAMRKRTLSP